MNREITDRMLKKVLFAAAALALTAVLLALSDRADAGESDKVEAVWINPEYADAAKEDGGLCVVRVYPSHLQTADPADFELAAAATREDMIERKDSVNVNFRIPKGSELSQLSFQEIFDAYMEIVYEYQSGDGRAGDYLHHNVKSVHAGGSLDSFTSTEYDFYYLVFSCEYNSDADMEEYVDETVSEIVSGINKDLSDRGKQNNQADIFYEIYKYITANVDYDYSHLNTPEYRPQYTAYNGLHEGKCVCQGFALLFYRIALEMGLDAGYISSHIQNHGWNIVKIGNKWYEMDVTWDEACEPEDYRFCLRGTSGWLNIHKISGSSFSTIGDEFGNEEFAAAHPLYEDDFEMWAVKTPDYKAVKRAEMSITDTLALTFAASDSLDTARDWAADITLNGMTQTVVFGQNGTLSPFVYAGITSDCMSDIMSVRLRAICGDASIYSFDEFTFSVRDYCNMLYDTYGSQPAYEHIIRLAADMLEYGAAVQQYSDYNTDDPANSPAWVDVNKTAAASKPESDLHIGYPAGEDFIKGAALVLGNDVRFGVAVQTDCAWKMLRIYDADGVTFGDYALSDAMTQDGCLIITGGLKALDFARAFTFDLNNGEHTVSYSVNSYINSMWDCGDARLSALVKALYNYGQSALAAA